MVSVLVKDKNTRDRVRLYLKNHNIETRLIFHPAHKMPVFFSKISFPIAESLSERGINLPSSPNLNRDEVQYICKLIKESLLDD